MQGSFRATNATTRVAAYSSRPVFSQSSSSGLVHPGQCSLFVGLSLGLCLLLRAIISRNRPLRLLLLMLLWLRDVGRPSLRQSMVAWLLCCRPLLALPAQLLRL